MVCDIRHIARHPSVERPSLAARGPGGEAAVLCLTDECAEELDGQVLGLDFDIA